MRFVVPALLLVACGGGDAGLLSPEYGPICSDHHCGCPSGWLLCDEACIDVARDRENCGSCGRQCLPSMDCVHGVCGCAGGMSFCHVGCVDLHTDVANCGDCYNACPLGMSCSAGECRCPAGRTACDLDCVDLLNDALNCGKCGHSCGAYTCLDGRCVQD